MKMTQVLAVTICLVVLLGCGGASQEEASALAESKGVEPTPVFTDNFESGEAEGWTEGEKTQTDDGPEDDAPAE